MASTNNDDKSDKIYIRSLKRSAQVKSVALKATPSYVEDYFKKNGKKKPEITLKIHRGTLDNARHLAMNGLMNNSLTPIVATTYLYRLGLTVSEDLDGDWISYGVTIGSKGTSIGPIDIINAKPSEVASTETPSGKTPTAADDHWMVIAITGYYRLALAPDQNTYINELINKLSSQMKAAGYNGAIKPRRNPAFATSPNFATMIAVFDMFWCKFPNNGMSDSRIGTLNSRFQDCTILGSLDYLAKATGLTPSQVFRWIFNAEVSKEAIIIILSPDEIDQLDSYLPYLHGLLLVEKSPYSASSCSNLHYWLHFIGCCFVLKRSMDARLVDGANVAEIPRASVLAAYALKEATDMRIRFTQDQSESDLADKAGQVAKATESDSEPSNRSPSAWYQWFLSMDKKYTKPMKNFVISAQRRMETVRKGSIGASFKAYVP